MLRRLTVNYPPIMFHPLNTITAHKGLIIYDTPPPECQVGRRFRELTWVPAGGGAPRQPRGSAEPTGARSTGPAGAGAVTGRDGAADEPNLVARHIDGQQRCLPAVSLAG